MPVPRVRNIVSVLRRLRRPPHRRARRSRCGEIVGHAAQQPHGLAFFFLAESPPQPFMHGPGNTLEGGTASSPFAVRETCRTRLSSAEAPRWIYPRFSSLSARTVVCFSFCRSDGRCGSWGGDPRCTDSRESARATAPCREVPRGSVPASEICAVRAGCGK